MTAPAPALHDVGVSTTPGGSSTPAASRSRGPGWRDPRLWVGVAIIAASVVGGARLLGAADDTVTVWAATTTHGAGDHLTPDDLSAVRVRFADDTTLAGYYAAADTLPSELVLTRGVGEGELLPRAAVGAPEQTGLVEVPVAVAPELVPGSVAAGAVVDVYLVAPAGTAPGDGPAPTPGQPALSRVTVLDAPQAADSFATSGKRQLVLAVPDEDASTFFRLLGSTTDPVVTVVRRG